MASTELVGRLMAYDPSSYVLAVQRPDGTVGEVRFSKYARAPMVPVEPVVPPLGIEVSVRIDKSGYVREVKPLVPAASPAPTSQPIHSRHRQRTSHPSSRPTSCLNSNSRRPSHSNRPSIQRRYPPRLGTGQTVGRITCRRSSGSLSDRILYATRLHWQ